MRNMITSFALFFPAAAVRGVSVKRRNHYIALEEIRASIHMFNATVCGNSFMHISLTNTILPRTHKH
jgi:hypothetical protein